MLSSLYQNAQVLNRRTASITSFVHPSAEWGIGVYQMYLGLNKRSTHVFFCLRNALADEDVRIAPVVLSSTVSRALGPNLSKNGSEVRFLASQLSKHLAQ
jgi:hypothetical protein